MRRMALAALAALFVIPGAAAGVYLPDAAAATPPDATARELGATITTYAVEFEWLISDASAGTTVTIEYRGCGGQLAGRFSQRLTGSNGIPIYANTHKLGSDWRWTLTITQDGREPHVEESVNTDPALFFDCTGEELPMVERWSRPTHVPKNLTAGATARVTGTSLTDFGTYREAYVDYTWRLNGQVVSRDTTLTLADEWVGRDLSMVVTVESTTISESRTLPFGTVLPAPTKRSFKRLTFDACRGEYRHDRFCILAFEKIKVLGDDAHALRVYKQVRRCGTVHTKFRNSARQTTTTAGVFDFGASGRELRKYQHKEYDLDYSKFYRQWRVFIPADSKYTALREWGTCYKLF